MKAVILAAGRGSRMGVPTDDRPKCLMRIGRRTLLDRQMHALRRAGVERIGIVTGWRSEAFAGIQATFFHNPCWAETTMVGSLAAAEDWLAAEPVVVSYGDIVYTPETVRALATAPGALALAYDPDWYALWSLRFSDPLADAETFLRGPSGELLTIGQRPTDLSQVQGQYVGLLKVTPAAWAVLRRVRETDRDARRLDMTGMLRYLIVRHLLPVATVPVSGPWYEFDHPSDVRVGRAVLEELDAWPDR